MIQFFGYFIEAIIPILIFLGVLNLLGHGISKKVNYVETSEEDEESK